MRAREDRDGWASSSSVAHVLRRTHALVAGLFASLVLAGALAALPALALPARGHIFATTFATPGSAEGQLSEPADVAIDEASGEVYVSDAGNERVEIFKPGAGGAYEYAAQFKLRDPGPITVDNSTSESDPTRGEVYVAGARSKEEAEEGRNTLFVYSPVKGEVTQKIHLFKFKEKGGEEAEEEFEEGISGLSVDSAARCGSTGAKKARSTPLKNS